MELIRMISEGYATELTEGEPIEGYDSVLWVERYQEPGEFKIKAKVSSGLMQQLPIGAFLSHVNTRELMRVENFLIKEPKGKDATIEITGRSLVSFLEERIVAQNHVAGGGADIYDYQINSAPTWEQIQYLIYDHLVDAIAVDFDDSLPGVYVNHSCSGTGTEEHRHVEYGTILDRTVELLKIDHTGIRMLRPTPTEPDMFFNIYQGADKTKTVRFSSLMGDLENVEYLITFKKEKNFIRMVGRWVQTVDGDASVNIDRRYMIQDASYLDQQFTAMPTGTSLSLVQAAMVIRGREIIKNYKNIMITQADISPSSRYRYGVDYNLGDLVTVDANFNQTQTMRVVEFSESEDENGTSGTPTLAIPGD